MYLLLLFSCVEANEISIIYLFYNVSLAFEFLCKLYCLFFFLQKCFELSAAAVLFLVTEYSAGLASWDFLLLPLDETFIQERIKAYSDIHYSWGNLN